MTLTPGVFIVLNYTVSPNKSSFFLMMKINFKKSSIKNNFWNVSIPKVTLNRFVMLNVSREVLLSENCGYRIVGHS